MEQKTYEPMVSGVNPFVRSALIILDADNRDECTVPELAAVLAEHEPMLSPFNLECAAREALRLWPDFKKVLEERARRDAEVMQPAQEGADHDEHEVPERDRTTSAIDIRTHGV